MASKAHLKRLKSGPRVWNEWRKSNRLVIPDLSDADLSGANLSEMDLHGADLHGAYLRRSRLSGADLSRADLNGANLEAADLSRADLREASLRWAVLSRADLSRAHLSAADMSGADLMLANLSGAFLGRARLSDAMLRGADLSDSTMGQTELGSVDLRGVKGLRTVLHLAPSAVGIDTILLSSKREITKVFLQRAGVPAYDLIAPARSPVDSHTEYHSCFISYSSRDNKFAQRLYADLREEHVQCWFAPEHLQIGDKFRTRIDKEIRARDKLLLILSKNSVKSPWVEDEVEAAFEKERQQNRPVLFPIRLDDAVMKTRRPWAAAVRRIHHMGDFRHWENRDRYNEAFTRLLRDLKPAGTEAQQRREMRRGKTPRRFLGTLPVPDF